MLGIFYIYAIYILTKMAENTYQNYSNNDDDEFYDDVDPEKSTFPITKPPEEYLVPTPLCVEKSKFQKMHDKIKLKLNNSFRRSNRRQEPCYVYLQGIQNSDFVGKIYEGLKDQPTVVIIVSKNI